MFTCVGWQVTLCDPIWQMTLCSCVIEKYSILPLTAIQYLYLLNFAERIVLLQTLAALVRRLSRRQFQVEPMTMTHHVDLSQPQTT